MASERQNYSKTLIRCDSSESSRRTNAGNPGHNTYIAQRGIVSPITPPQHADCEAAPGLPSAAIGRNPCAVLTPGNAGHNTWKCGTQYLYRRYKYCVPI